MKATARIRLEGRKGKSRPMTAWLNRLTPHPGPLPIEGRGGAAAAPRCHQDSRRIRKTNGGEQDGFFVAKRQRLLQALLLPPSPLNGERIRRTSSHIEPLNPVGTRSTASPSSGLQLGTQWNASLPVPAGRFMERAGVRGEEMFGVPNSSAASRTLNRISVDDAPPFPNPL
jgi:hypothetical protein